MRSQNDVNPTGLPCRKSPEDYRCGVMSHTSEEIKEAPVHCVTSEFLMISTACFHLASGGNTGANFGGHNRISRSENK